MPSRAGSPNKRSYLANAAIREAFPDYDPLVAMVRLANDPTKDDQLRFNAHKEIAQYMYPKRKAVELSGVEGAPLDLEIVIAPHAAPDRQV